MPEKEIPRWLSEQEKIRRWEQDRYKLRHKIGGLIILAALMVVLVIVFRLFKMLLSIL